jgi:cobalt/nickel transport system permease protein
MIDIDQYAYLNNLRRFHPLEKMIFALLTMVITITFDSLFTSLIVILLLSLLIVSAAGVPLSFYLKLLLIPLSFLLPASAASALSISRSLNEYLIYAEIGGWYLFLEYAALSAALNLFFRSFAAICCLYFLTLTTPMLEVIAVLRKLKLPEIFIEMMLLIYRFIFVLLDTADLIRLSQLSRLGYSSLARSFRSSGQLISNLFIRAYYRSKGLFTALEARGYDGKLRVLEREYNFSYKNLLKIILFEFVLIIISIYGGGHFV